MCCAVMLCYGPGECVTVPRARCCGGLGSHMWQQRSALCESRVGRASDAAAPTRQPQQACPTHVASLVQQQHSLAMCLSQPASPGLGHPSWPYVLRCVLQQRLPKDKATRETWWFPWLKMGCGATAGISAQLLTYPLDTLRRRMQVSSACYCARCELWLHCPFLAACLLVGCHVEAVWCPARCRCTLACCCSIG
jgi:hypothetical protein